MKKEFNVLIFREDKTYIARCVELLITENGNSIDKVLENLKKTIAELSKQYNLVELGIDIEKNYKGMEYLKKKITVEL